MGIASLGQRHQRWSASIFDPFKSASGIYTQAIKLLVHKLHFR
jgi:hypothetical protein